MAFKKTAISLIVIAFVTAGVAAVYLWYNFNSRSNLILVVPQKCHWFYHFQTKRIRNKMPDYRPVYLDSISTFIADMPLFKNVKDPGEVGITILSDIIVFETDHGRFLALSVTSEPRLKRFFTEVIPPGMSSGIISGKNCNFVKFTNHNLYLAYKHKALVLFEPNDTSDNLNFLENAFKDIFIEESKALITQIPEVKALYKEDCDVVFYNTDKKTQRFATHGVVLGKENIEIKGKNAQWLTIASVYSHDGMPGIPNRKKHITYYDDLYHHHISATQYVDLNLQRIYQSLKNYN